MRYRQNQKKRAPWLTALLILFSAIFLFSAFMLIKYYVGSARENAAFQQLQKAVHQAKATESGGENSGEDRASYLSKLYETNGDLAGWLTIGDTRVDYPVMLTPSDPEYYLRRAFDGKYAESGCLFIGEGCTTDSDNITIYGHNMNDGSMFADLLKYEDKAYYSNHKALRFDTLTSEKNYAVIAVLKTEVSGEHFPYYGYPDFADEAAFDSYMEELLSLSLYEAEHKATYGDQLLTLSTCSYHHPDGRLVVIAAEV